MFVLTNEKKYLVFKNKKATNGARMPYQ